jgi:hypothetical protein
MARWRIVHEGLVHTVSDHKPYAIDIHGVYVWKKGGRDRWERDHNASGNMWSDIQSDTSWDLVDDPVSCLPCLISEEP